MTPLEQLRQMPDEPLPNLRHQMTPADMRNLRKTAFLLNEYIYPLLMDLQDGKCNHCGTPDENMDVDHKLYHPRMTVYDLQLLCRPCHIAKHPDKPVLKGSALRGTRYTATEDPHVRP